MASGYCWIWLDPHLMGAKLELWDQSYIGGTELNEYVADLFSPLSPDGPYFMNGETFPEANLYRIKFPRQQINGVWYEKTQLPYQFTFQATLEETIPITPENDRIPTTLTISAPATIKPDETFTISGRLSETSGLPIPNQLIALSYDGVTLGSAQTNIDGNYMIQAFIPTKGTYILKAVFAGAETLGASEGTTRTSTTPTNILLPLVVLAAVAYKVFKK